MELRGLNIQQRHTYKSFLLTDVDTDQVGFHVTYTRGSNPGNPDCTSGLHTRVIFVCNKDAKWQSEDITSYIEIERETCFVSLMNSDHCITVSIEGFPTPSLRL